MTERKLQELIRNLYHYSSLEEEAYHLYSCLASKMNSPEGCFILGIAYDSMKNSRIITESIKAIDFQPDENKASKLDFSKEIIQFVKTVSKINNIDNETFCVMMKELIKLEDFFTEKYSKFIESQGPDIITNELSELIETDPKIFKRLFEVMIKEKQRHREVLTEIYYYFGRKDEEKAKNRAPVTKYQNPDAWIKPPTMDLASS